VACLVEARNPTQQLFVTCQRKRLYGRTRSNRRITLSWIVGKSVPKWTECPVEDSTGAAFCTYCRIESFGNNLGQLRNYKLFLNNVLYHKCN
jgi:hypothetical protein